MSNSQMEQDGERAPRKPFQWVTVRGLLVAVVFGLVALVFVALKITLPIPGTEFVSDPRELLVTLGSAISGPVGALIIGFLAGVADTSETVLPSIVAHIVAGMFLAVAYRFCTKLPGITTPRLAVLWILSIVVYYFGALMPAFFLTYRLTTPEPFDFWQAYLGVARGAIGEIILIAFITTAVMVLLPRRYRRPMWGN